MANINDNYFEGIYKDIWRYSIPEILTQRETNFIITYFGLLPGAKVLDLMCGYGRHALSLARNGITVTAVDNLDSYIKEIQDTARSEFLPVEAVRANVVTYLPKGNYDLVICMGNSLNFYDEKDTRVILSRTSDALKKGGHLLINTWSLAEIVLPVFKEKSQGIVNGIECFTESRQLHDPLRIESLTKFIAKNGTIEERTALDYIYTVDEISSMIAEAGFAVKEIYSIPGKKKFSSGEPRAYIIAEKR